LKFEEEIVVKTTFYTAEESNNEHNGADNTMDFTYTG
jgi:hypothetical protein